MFEAFLGALYLDRGFDVARRWLVGLYEENVDFAELVAHQDTAKSVLNRHCMRHLGFVPAVDQLDAGVVRLRHPASGAVISTGVGTCRRDAEDDAVRKAMRYYNLNMFSLSKEPPPPPRPDASLARRPK